MIRKDFEGNPKMLQLLIDAYCAQNDLITEHLADEFDYADSFYNDGTAGAHMAALNEAFAKTQGE